MNKTQKDIIRAGLKYFPPSSEINFKTAEPHEIRNIAKRRHGLSDTLAVFTILELNDATDLENAIATFTTAADDLSSVVRGLQELKEGK